MKSGDWLVNSRSRHGLVLAIFAWVVVVPVGRPLPNPSLRESSRRSGRPLRSRRADTSCLCGRPDHRRRSHQVDVLFAPRATSNCTPGPGLCPPQRQSVRISCRLSLYQKQLLHRHRICQSETVESPKYLPFFPRWLQGIVGQWVANANQNQSPVAPARMHRTIGYNLFTCARINHLRGPVALSQSGCIPQSRRPSCFVTASSSGRSALLGQGFQYLRVCL
jgi:hypothetical protein